MWNSAITYCNCWIRTLFTPRGQWIWDRCVLIIYLVVYLALRIVVSFSKIDRYRRRSMNSSMTVMKCNQSSNSTAYLLKNRIPAVDELNYQSVNSIRHPVVLFLYLFNIRVWNPLTKTQLIVSAINYRLSRCKIFFPLRCAKLLSVYVQNQSRKPQPIRPPSTSPHHHISET